MLRKLLGALATVALPALLAAQTPKAPAAGAVRGKAMRVQGEVVRPADAVRTAGDIDHNQSDGDKAEDQKDAQEGPDVDEGPEANEGPDVDEGPEANEGPDVEEGPQAGEQAKGQGREGDTDEAKPPTPSPAGRHGRIGSHKP